MHAFKGIWINLSFCERCRKVKGNLRLLLSCGDPSVKALVVLIVA